jgi:hypothetical protein
MGREKNILKNVKKCFGININLYIFALLTKVNLFSLFIV